MVFFYWLEESSQDSLKQTKDGGWICGEDIDVSVDEGGKSDTEVQEEVLPLEVQLGKGKGWVCGACIICFIDVFLLLQMVQSQNDIPVIFLKYHTV